LDSARCLGISRADCHTHLVIEPQAASTTTTTTTTTTAAAAAAVKAIAAGGAAAATNFYHHATERHHPASNRVKEIIFSLQAWQHPIAAAAVTAAAAAAAIGGGGCGVDCLSRAVHPKGIIKVHPACDICTMQHQSHNILGAQKDVVCEDDCVG
jgi:hypothetical protein